MQFRDLKTQYQSIKPKIDQAILDTVASGGFIGGTTVSALETRLAKFVGAKHCVSCANGTDALSLALMAWGVGPGDAVFVPDFTFFATAEVVSLSGATPVFVDVDDTTYNLDPNALEAAVKKVLDKNKLRPRAAIPVDLFGLCADYPTIRKIADRYQLKMLEDGAQGFGGRIGDSMACSFGDISTTSFFPAKPLGCYGDGGAIFTDDDSTAELIRSLAVHGKGAKKYDNVRIGMNSRLDAIQAAILNVKMDAFEAYELADINRCAALYSELIADYVNAPQVPAGYYSSWAQYTIQLENSEARDRVQSSLKEKGIPAMVYYPKPMHAQGAFSHLEYAGNCPVTERLCKTVLSLPMHPYLNEDDIALVANEIKNNL